MTPPNGQSDITQATLQYTMLIGATGGIGQADRTAIMCQ